MVDGRGWNANFSPTIMLICLDRLDATRFETSNAVVALAILDVCLPYSAVHRL